MSLETFLFILMSGILLGGLYALMATGLAIVWTTLGVFNFAHGAFVALGAYVAWQINTAMPFAAGFPIAALLAMAIMFVFAFAAHFVLIKPFERYPNVVLLAVISTLAAATIIESGILLGWGPRDKQIPVPIEGAVSLFGARINLFDLIALAVSVLSLFALAAFLQRTTLGRSMRAVAQNREAAELMGLNVPLLFAIALGLSGAAAALAGTFAGSIRFINPSFGADPLMKSLVVVILGGVARFSSPIYAAFVVGIAEAFASYFLGLYWAPAVLFAMMIAVLLVKPEGLFGRQYKTL
ncbi:MAG: branched-chain amino acid ABC transporter permease [Pseudomonadota bacterium]